MPRINKSELLHALAAAEASRPVHPGLGRVPPLTSPKLSATQRALEQQLRPVLVKAGFKDRRFEDLRKQHDAELQRAAEREHSAAVRRSAKIRKTLRAGAANRRRAAGTLANLPVAPFLTIIDKPFLIWAKPRSGIIFDSQIAPGDSWAKVKAVAGTGDKMYGSDNLSFYFLWDNPSDYYAVIDASTFITVNGFARAECDGGFWSGLDPQFSHYSYFSCQTYMTLWQWSDQPPTPSVTASQTVFTLNAEAGFFGDKKTTPVSGSFDHDYTHYVVNPRGVVVFEVVLAMNYSIYDGHILGDFAEGSFDISCPFMVVGLLSAPPVGPMATSTVTA